MTPVIVGGVSLVLLLALGEALRRAIKKGNEAQALLGAAYDSIRLLKEENARLRRPLTTAEERAADAAAELLRRGVPGDHDGSAT